MSKFAYEDISEVVFNYAGVTKHGTHNQKTHGGKGGGSEPTFASIGDFYEHMQKPENQARTYEEDQALTTSQKPEYGQSAVFAYVNNSSDLNTALRENPEFAERKFGSVIADLDETMVRVPNITESITVYRGVRGGDDFPEALKGLEAGDSFFDSAFTSTTLNPGTAAGFAGVFNAEDTQGVVFEIIVPANSEGIFPNSWLGYDGNNFASELEFLLPRDSEFKVLSTEGKVWKLEVVNNG